MRRKLLWGSWAGYLIAAAALVSCFGALNGWILMQGQLPQAVANNGLFPKVLAKESKFGTPVVALVVSSVFASILILMSLGSSLGGLGQTLVEMFNILILITTFFTLVPYMLCAMAEIVLSRKQKRVQQRAHPRRRDRRRAFIFGCGRRRAPARTRSTGARCSCSPVCPSTCGRRARLSSDSGSIRGPHQLLEVVHARLALG